MKKCSYESQQHECSCYEAKGGRQGSVELGCIYYRTDILDEAVCDHAQEGSLSMSSEDS